MSVMGLKNKAQFLTQGAEDAGKGDNLVKT